MPVKDFIGFEYADDCLYWVHTHHPSDGVIHMEAPYKIVPTLGDFFRIWGQPLSRTRVASASVQPGESMRVFVNLKPYTGDPSTIRLTRHTLVTIEVGPPFRRPQSFAWNGL